MISVCLTGTGNLARHLFDALHNCREIKVNQVYNHRPESLDYFTGKTQTITSIDSIKPSDIHIVAVKDDVTQNMCEKLQDKGGIVAHTSGSQPIPDFARSGVFYPLQTFSKDKKIDFAEIPICIEAHTKKDEQKLKQLGELISSQVQILSAKQRLKLHLAAVFACNFSNHVMALSHSICEENGIEFSLLQKLILETAQKAVQSDPVTVQTGPAVRGDEQTLKAHEKLLEGKPDLQSIYRLLSESIKHLK